MAVCLAFDYLYQITFIGAVLALCGMAEEKRLHSFIFLPLRKKTSTGSTSLIHSVFCYPKEEETMNISQTKSLRFFNFWESLASLLTKKVSKAIVLMIFGVYLSMAMWSFTKLNFRCSFVQSLMYGSYQHSFYSTYEENYYQYERRIQIILNTTLNYADPKVQNKVLKMVEGFESDPLFSGPQMTDCWLRSYKMFLADRRVTYFLRNYDMSDKSVFYYILRRFFFRHPLASRFKKDVVFNHNKTEIVSSRFILQTNITRNDTHLYYQLRDFKKVLAEAEYPMIVYHPFFYYFDGLDATFVMMVQTICVITALVTFISALLLPNVICILCVGFSIVSVVTGVLGYMFLWNVSIEVTTVIVLIVTCGFSVDYAAHVSCAYVSCKDKDPNERLRKAIIMTGMPIFQGSVSTICVVVFFFDPPSYEFGVTCKIISLVSVIAALHGIIVIPVIMSLLDSASRKVRTLIKYSNQVELNIPSPKANLSHSGFYEASFPYCNGIYKITS